MAGNRIKSRWPSWMLWACLGGAPLAGGCNDSGRDAEKDAVVSQYVDVVRASYDEAIAGAKALRSAISDMVVEPSQATLDAARKAWIDARPAYMQTVAYRFYEGPIDNAQDGRENRINAWPVDAAGIDYARAGQNMTRTGIINDRKKFPDINKDTLIEQNQKGSPDHVTLGYHAIEFLLWGQDASDQGPGARPFSDYVAGQAGGEPDADRRRQYIGLAAELLIDDLQYVRDQWSDGKPYLKEFLANVDDKSLRNMIKGITSLTRDGLDVEHLSAAYNRQDPEDEQSAFSDNTLEDLKNDLAGVENVYFGKYGKNDGMGLEDLVGLKDPDTDQRIKADLETAKKAVAAIPAPLDQALKTSSRKVTTAIDAVEALHDSLAQMSSSLGL